MTLNALADGSAWVDGEIVPVAEARLPLLDWGFLHSDATYDVAHVWHGRFFRLDDHIERFFAGMDALHLNIPHDRAEVADILAQLVAQSGLRDAYVEMICTRGQPAPGSRDPRTCRNCFYAFAVPFIWIADPDHQEIGLNLVITERQRIPPAAVDPRVKNYHWLDLVMALFDAYEQGGETAATVDDHGNVIEGPGFNLFAVRNGGLHTPAHGVLEGITRRTVIELARAAGRCVEVGALPADAVHAADEVFITSTAGGVMPVTRIDGRPVGEGTPGPITRELRRAYWAVHEDPAYTRGIDYR
jgi:branched-chain amino acid aminotransferase